MWKGAQKKVFVRKDEFRWEAVETTFFIYVCELLISHLGPSLYFLHGVCIFSVHETRVKLGQVEWGNKVPSKNEEKERLIRGRHKKIWEEEDDVILLLYEEM